MNAALSSGESHRYHKSFHFLVGRLILRIWCIVINMLVNESRTKEHMINSAINSTENFLMFMYLASRMTGRRILYYKTIWTSITVGDGYMKNTGWHAYVNNLHKAKDSNYSKSYVKHFPCLTLLSILQFVVVKLARKERNVILINFCYLNIQCNTE